jgi:hypothetical protein
MHLSDTLVLGPLPLWGRLCAFPWEQRWPA